jgi:hypothetical protein
LLYGFEPDAFQNVPVTGVYSEAGFSGGLYLNSDAVITNEINVMALCHN